MDQRKKLRHQLIAMVKSERTQPLNLPILVTEDEEKDIIHTLDSHTQMSIDSKREGIA